MAGHPPVCDKYDVAESRLRSVTKRLVKENIYEVYDDVLRQWRKEVTVKKFKRGFYVDDLTISVENQQELLEFKTQTMKIRNAASFELRFWAHTGTKHSETQNVLGLKILYGNFKKATLHIFTDASAHGYTCCAFLRCEDEGKVKVSLISAKARVAPVQRPTIPKLELLGAAIGARIASEILEALDLPFKTYF
ncbi:uncharacterized protein CDAR_503861 [Caerostris darwini]|uniref:Uncharacterized protein n=1 Tax=Caerostris darwini TaxID=1538125 RepID=A0AAV4PCM5_9ARAC|nr:uncharacterized protein CDAR_503861 [Caerostris darwini]